MPGPRSSEAAKSRTVLEEAVLRWIDEYEGHLVEEYVDIVSGEPRLKLEGSVPESLAAALLTVELIREVRQHSRTLVWLTWALLVTSGALVSLTAVLIWRTFG